MLPFCFNCKQCHKDTSTKKENVLRIGLCMDCRTMLAEEAIKQGIEIRVIKTIK